MDVEDAIDLVCARLVEADAFRVKIRTREKLCKNEVDELFTAIDFLISHYKGHALIPKRLASAFVDVYVGFSVSDAFFDDSESQWYEDIGIAL